jgi:hypothetical protein
MLTDKALSLKQKDVIKLQDEMLLDIESGVGRLHEKALQIGDEAKTHTRLLDDLDSNVDIATAALQVRGLQICVSFNELIFVSSPFFSFFLCLFLCLLIGGSKTC